MIALALAIFIQTKPLEIFMATAVYVCLPFHTDLPPSDTDRILTRYCALLAFFNGNTPLDFGTPDIEFRPSGLQNLFMRA